MSIDEILKSSVSFQPNTWTYSGEEKTLLEVFSEINSEKYCQRTKFLRNFLKVDDSEGYGIHKKSLACVTFCATFSTARKKEYLKKYNYILVLDIDKLDPDELFRVKNCLMSDDYVFAFWESPSGNGIKGLVFVSYGFGIDSNNIDQSHKSAFQKLQEYFSVYYKINLDDSGSDITRLCFLSCDTNLIIKPNFKAFGVNENDFILSKTKTVQKSNNSLDTISSKDILFNPKNKNNPYNRKIIQSIIKFLSKRKLSITYTYDEWYKVAYAIADTFTYDHGEKYFLALSELDTKYNELNCKNILKYSYANKSGKIKFSTIIFFAKQKGYLTTIQRSGVPKMDS